MVRKYNEMQDQNGEDWYDFFPESYVLPDDEEIVKELVEIGEVCA